jgi:hypothetical protein
MPQNVSATKPLEKTSTHNQAGFSPSTVKMLKSIGAYAEVAFCRDYYNILITAIDACFTEPVENSRLYAKFCRFKECLQHPAQQAELEQAFLPLISINIEWQKELLDFFRHTPTKATILFLELILVSENPIQKKLLENNFRTLLNSLNLESLANIRENLEKSKLYYFNYYCPSLATKEMPIPMQPAEETPAQLPIIQAPLVQQPAEKPLAQQTPPIPTAVVSPLAQPSTGSTLNKAGLFASGVTDGEEQADTQTASSDFPGANRGKTAAKAAEKLNETPPVAQLGTEPPVLVTLPIVGRPISVA